MNAITTEDQRLYKKLEGDYTSSGVALENSKRFCQEVATYAALISKTLVKMKNWKQEDKNDFHYYGLKMIVVEYTYKILVEFLDYTAWDIERHQFIDPCLTALPPYRWEHPDRTGLAALSHFMKCDYSEALTRIWGKLTNIAISYSHPQKIEIVERGWKLFEKNFYDLSFGSADDLTYEDCKSLFQDVKTWIRDFEVNIREGMLPWSYSMEEI